MKQEKKKRVWKGIAVWKRAQEEKSRRQRKRKNKDQRESMISKAQNMIETDPNKVECLPSMDAFLGISVYSLHPQIRALGAVALASLPGTQHFTPQRRKREGHCDRGPLAGGLQGEPGV